ncbi:hypothetical protein C8Q78DRAFT_241458 [Trametes maxima]|nr:hypothetical protein C8Q78DRAFT_241458 [Trametes maxima]
MVYVNDKKFACESCIKGHRSSSCQHTDRPLFEIKKKGRPVSQCEKCRELRKTKRMHSKCTCSSTSTSEAGPSSQAQASKVAGAADGATAKGKTRRFKPIAPALPNGIKDIVPPTPGPSSAGNVHLCRCGGKDASICTCAHDRAPPLSASATGGLAALAQAAMFCCGGDIPSASLPPTVAPTPVVMVVHDRPNAVIAEEDKSRKHPRGCCSSQPSSRPPSPKPKRSKHSSHTHSVSSTAPAPPPFFSNLPVFTPASQPPAGNSMGPPAFPPIPSISTITSFAAPECCCGTDCACPGCLKHRGEAHASKDFEDCAEGSCGICVDNEGGIELPEAAFAASQGGFASTSRSSVSPTSTLSLSTPGQSSNNSQKTGTSFIDAFFARAAALPPPPPSRMRPGTLDPTNVLVYPPDLFSGDAEKRRERGAAFGLVEVPKLRCSCPGGCGCPEGQCGCGDSCTGCGPCLDEGDDASVATVQVVAAPSAGASTAGRTAARSCCS